MSLFSLTREPCIPPLWAKNSHQQTILAYFLPSEKPNSSGEQVRVPLADGDQLSGTLYRGTSSTLLIVFHGLIGSTDSNYMGRMAKIAERHNHSILLMNHRGCGSGEGLAKRPYHSGRGDDISETIFFCREHFKNKQIIAVGFSLGANSLLTLLTGIRGEHQPDKAIAVNGPSDLKACSESLKQGWNRLYDLFFVQGCKKDIAKKIKMGTLHGHFPISSFAHLSEVDEVYTAPQGGFKNAEDYYAQCSTAPHLQKIKTQTFILMSKDDPFIPWQPYLSAQNNPNVHLHLEDVGGHMGYICKDRGPLGYKRWMDETIESVLLQMS